MTFFFSAVGAGAGSRAGAAAGPAPVHPLNEFRQFVQQSPSGLGAPQTAHSLTAGFACAAVDGPAGAAAGSSSRPQHTQ